MCLCETCFLSSATATAPAKVTDHLQEPKGKPQLIPVYRSLQGEGLAAGSKTGQQKFLEMFGLVKLNLSVQEENVLEADVAKLIATGLNHTDKGEVLEHDLFDPYYTPEQWELRHGQVEKYLTEVCGSAGNHLSSTQLTSYKEALSSSCQCVAHSSHLEWVWKLIDIPEPVTDDWGSKLILVVIPLLLKSAGLEDLDVEGGRQGSPHAVNFILRLPSGESQQLTGWPDFTITHRYTPYAEQRILRSYARRSRRLHGVGEVQSQETKTGSIAQAGIYGVGQLAKGSVKRMAVIILFRDKSAQVAVTSIQQPSDPCILHENSVGEVQFKIVSRLDAMSLKSEEDLQEFARIFISTLKWTSQE